MSVMQWIFPEYDRRLVLSLAGVMQSTSLVESLSNSGSCDPAGFDRCLLSLLNTSPENEADIFGSDAEMKIGLDELIRFCDSKTQNQTAVRYAIQILHLQKLLNKNAPMQEKIQSGLLHAQKQMLMYGVQDENLIRNLADLYQNSISTLGFRIQIMGKHHYLQQDMIAARVRLLLFSGVRFAFLWRQSGGHSRHLLIAKRAIGNAAHVLTN